jgi:hypothetical protein
MVDPKATQRQRDLAQLAYDEAAQNLEEIGVRNQRLADEKAAADKAGIEGPVRSRRRRRASPRLRRGSRTPAPRRLGR